MISLDGLNPTALTKLGSTGAPALHRMMRQGASTLNARAEVEQTETLPNHTGMVTGRRIEKARDGHAVTWNDERLSPFTVQEAAEHGVDSIFSLAKRQGLTSALYSAKEKFSLFDRSWPDGTDKVLIDSDNDRLATVAVRDLQQASYDFAFLHISLPDRAGHASGWLSAPYLDAVRQSDALVGQVLEAVRADSRLSDRVTVMLTADHGGPRGQRNHAEAGKLANYRVPFLMWGAGVARGADSTRSARSSPTPGRAGSGTAPRASRSATPSWPTPPPRSSACRRSAAAASAPPASSTGADHPPTEASRTSHRSSRVQARSVTCAGAKRPVRRTEASRAHARSVTFVAPRRHFRGPAAEPPREPWFERGFCCASGTRAALRA